ncbi:lytic transglycosylase domain-containing protein [Aquidulcibacter paucihalophilus]|uniref:lytic transglycosylase domain-containing protein n=1 Tax=Aquidulcibacter paucihalophilus TaxID=1978549 RepID=UPI000A18F171|nr:lytic transglycosylase domain-containing protein [Aquidulcibacter paucihalophilus]
MVGRPSVKLILAGSLALGALTPGFAFAEPVDWATSGGTLFASSGLERRPPLIDPIDPSAPQGPPAAALSRPRSAVNPLYNPYTDRLGDVRLLPSNQPLDRLITRIANETGLDPKLLHALVIIESAYDSRAISPVGAQGLTQLMPGTAAELGVRDAFDSEENLRAGARYLAIQIGRFSDIRLALAAFNSGPNRVARLGRVPDINETQNYVRDGIDCYLALTAGRGIRNRSQCRTGKGR